MSNNINYSEMKQQIVIGVGKIKAVKTFKIYDSEELVHSMIIDLTDTVVGGKYRSAIVKVEDTLLTDVLGMNVSDLVIGSKLAYFGLLKECYSKDTQGQFKLTRNEIWVSKLEMLDKLGTVELVINGKTKITLY